MRTKKMQHIDLGELTSETYRPAVLQALKSHLPAVPDSKQPLIDRILWKPVKTEPHFLYRGFVGLEAQLPIYRAQGTDTPDRNYLHADPTPDRPLNYMKTIQIAVKVDGKPTSVGRLLLQRGLPLTDELPEKFEPLIRSRFVKFFEQNGLPTISGLFVYDITKMTQEPKRGMASCSPMEQLILGHTQIRDVTYWPINSASEAAVMLVTCHVSN